jgi:hypothetical protein
VTLMWRVLGTGVAALATLGMVALTDAPTLVEPDADGLLRLSWRMVGERVELCRPPTAEDLAALPRHMRPQEICEGRMAAFVLRVRVDEESVIDREIRPSGLREDRPVYVFEERRLAPGRHRIEVTFSQVEGNDREQQTLLELRSAVDVPARGVVLVTRDSEGGGLVLRDHVPSV